MVDLKELEKMLDETLANETDESLNEWFASRLSDELETFVGKTNVNAIDFGLEEHIFSAPQSNNVTKYNITDADICIKNNFKLAA